MAGSVEVRNLGKRFVRYEQQRPRTIKEHMMQGLRRSRISDRFWALRDVNLDVRPGKMLGVIGHNGSGKSTLLRMIGGIMRPDVGTIRTSGRISGLLELNAGMHPELSGRDNILIGGVIAGMTRREVLARMDEIIAFAELEEFIESPVRTYSSGMRMRLGFAVAIHTDPGVLLIDEVLSVGDMAFQAKCLERIRQHRNQGSAIILITHDLSQVEKLCDDALWLRGGQIVGQGAPDVLVGEYRAAMAQQTRDRTPIDLPERVTSSGVALRVHENRFGSLELEIEEVSLRNRSGHPVRSVEAGSPLAVHVRLGGAAGLTPIVGISIGTADGENIVDLNTLTDEVVMPATTQGSSIRLELDRLDLAPGEYFVDVGLYHPSWDYAYDYHWRVYPLEVTDKVRTGGMMSPPRRWIVGRDRD